MFFFIAGGRAAQSYMNNNKGALCFFFRGEGWHNPLNIWIGTIKKLSKKECRKKAVVNDRGSA